VPLIAAVGLVSLQLFKQDTNFHILCLALDLKAMVGSHSLRIMPVKPVLVLLMEYSLVRRRLARELFGPVRKNIILVFRAESRSPKVSARFNVNES
jgi:hypothetical protein